MPKRIAVPAEPATSGDENRRPPHRRPHHNETSRSWAAWSCRALADRSVTIVRAAGTQPCWAGSYTCRVIRPKTTSLGSVLSTRPRRELVEQAKAQSPGARCDVGQHWGFV